MRKVIGKSPGRVTKCAATIEFRRDGTVATSYDGRESVSSFTFRSHSWPRACTIEVGAVTCAARAGNSFGEEEAGGTVGAGGVEDIHDSWQNTTPQSEAATLLHELDVSSWWCCYLLIM